MCIYATSMCGVFWHPCSLFVDGTCQAYASMPPPCVRSSLLVDETCQICVSLYAAPMCEVLWHPRLLLVDETCHPCIQDAPMYGLLWHPCFPVADQTCQAGASMPSPCMGYYARLLLADDTREASMCGELCHPCFLLVDVLRIHAVSMCWKSWCACLL